MKRWLAVAAAFGALAAWLWRHGWDIEAKLPGIGHLTIVECDNPVCGCHWLLQGDPYLHEITLALAAAKAANEGAR